MSVQLGRRGRYVLEVDEQERLDTVLGGPIRRDHGLLRRDRPNEAAFCGCRQPPRSSLGRNGERNR